jgi:hypothetical protein
MDPNSAAKSSPAQSTPNLIQVIGKELTFRVRLLLALAGLLCLFFPGATPTVVIRSALGAFKKLSLYEQQIVMQLIEADND